jgi:hypothetical protein
VPFVKPVIVTGEEAAVPVKPPGDAVAVYEVIAPPPILDGAVKATEIEAPPAVAVPMVGASGTFNPL